MDKMYLNRFHTTDVKELSINGTTVTSTAAEINASSVVTSGTGAPGSAPTAIGQIYIDTNAGAVYISTGVTEAADWNALAEVAP